MQKHGGLSVIESIRLDAWSIPDGEWDRAGLDQESARGSLLTYFRRLQGDPIEAVKDDCGRLQQSLMAARRDTFEETQRHSPFSRHARANMEAFLRAWIEGGEEGFGREWARVFAPGWEAGRPAQEPVRIIVDTGDCQERALAVLGAPDRETRVAAEWWYLYHTFGRAWQPGLHLIMRGKEAGSVFGVHKIRVFPNSYRSVFFRLPWTVNPGAPRAEELTRFRME